MKRIGVFFLLFTLFARASDQTLAPIAQQLTSITKLSDEQLQSLWTQLQTIIANNAHDPVNRQKSKKFVDAMVKEKLRRISNNKEAQEAISKALLEVLLAVSFEGTALVLSGQPVEYAIRASAIRQLASSMGSYITRHMGAVISASAPSALQMFTNWVLKLPAAGQGLTVLDPISIIPLGASGTKAILNKLGYAEKTIDAFNRTQQAAANFIQSLI